MTTLQVRIERLAGCDDLELPRYRSDGAAGLDLAAAVAGLVVIEPGQRELIPTGVRIAVPAGAEGQVRPRSGLALQHGVTVLNAPGTIDSDYRGEVKVLLANLGAMPFTVERGMRIAQLVIARVEHVELVEQPLPETERSVGGFGSTGTDGATIVQAKRRR